VVETGERERGRKREGERDRERAGGCSYDCVGKCCWNGNGGANGRGTERVREGRDDGAARDGGEINTLRSPPPGVHG